MKARKILVVSIMWLLLVAMALFPILRQWSLARASGILAAILFPFSLWSRKHKGLPTALWYLLFVVYVWAYLWLYPAGIVGDSVLFLLTFVVCVLGVWETHKYSKWHKKARGRAETQYPAR